MVSKELEVFRSVYQVVRQRMLNWQSVIQVIKFLELDKDLAKDDVAGLQKLYREISTDTRLSGVGRDLLNVSYRGDTARVKLSE